MYSINPVFNLNLDNRFVYLVGIPVKTGPIFSTYHYPGETGETLGDLPYNLFKFKDKYKQRQGTQIGQF